MINKWKEVVMIDCHEDVTRGGESQPCNRMAVAMRRDPEDGHPYPVCAYHSRGDMVPLTKIASDQEYARLRVMGHMIMEWRRSMIVSASNHAAKGNPVLDAYARAQLECAEDIRPLLALGGLTEGTGPILGVFTGGRE